MTFKGQTGHCERCCIKDVQLYYVEISGKDLQGNSHVKIWLVCIWCFADLLDIDWSVNCGIP